MPARKYYVPRIPVPRPCACGCGILVSGTARRRYVDTAHRVRGWRSKETALAPWRAQAESVKRTDAGYDALLTRIARSCWCGKRNPCLEHTGG